MKKYIITEPVLAAIRAYLGTRPFDEVVEGMIALSNLEEVIEELPEPVAEEDL